MKRKTGGKLLSVLLTLAMLAALLPGMSLTARAADSATISKATPHTHDFTYTAGGATITATCNAADRETACPLKAGNYQATLTVVAPTRVLVDGAGDVNATVTDENGIQGAAKILYRTYDIINGIYGEYTETAPAALGVYEASVTLGTGSGAATASVLYAIRNPGGEATPVAEEDIVEIYSGSIELTGREGQEYIAVPKDTVPTEEHWRFAKAYSGYKVQLSYVLPDEHLTPITAYDIYTRRGETSTTVAGPASSSKLTVTTRLAGLSITADDYLGSLAGATYRAETEPAAGENGLTFQWYYYEGPIEYGTQPAVVTPITGAATDTYTLPESDVGKYFGVKVFKDGKEVGATWLSDPVRYAVATFDSKGGAPTPEAVNTLKFHDKIPRPGDPTRDGYNFAGWYDEDYQTAWNFDTDLVEFAEYPLFAKWTTADVYSISGVVMDSTETAPQNEVTVTLTRGNIILGKTVTNEQGAFAFSAESGAYNIIAKKGEQTRTELVELKENKSLTVTMPEAGKKSVLDNDAAGSFAATVGGLDEIAAETLSVGSSVTIQLTVTDGENANSLTTDEKTAFTTGKNAIAALPETSGKTVEYLNLKLEKTVAGSGTETVTDIGGTNDKLLTIIIPYATNGKHNLAVYRYHGTAAEAMTRNPAAGQEGFAFDADSLTIYARGFSTYAIGYDAPVSPPPAQPAVTPAYSSDDSSDDYINRVVKPENGTVSVNRDTASRGEKVTVTVKPNEGYEADTVTVSGSGGRNANVTKADDGTYTYIQPGMDVKINVTFRATGGATGADCPKDSSCPLSAYADADAQAWYHDGAHWALNNGVMNGVGGNQFDPNGETSRAMVVTMLWRLEGSPAYAGESGFDDVKNEDWYGPAVRWASAEGIVTGYEQDGSKVFNPDGAVTREQLAAMLYRCAQHKGQGFTGLWAFPLDYPDAASVSEWAYEAMCWLTVNGVINGMDGALAPASGASRAQVATMLMRYCENR